MNLTAEQARNLVHAQPPGTLVIFDNGEVWLKKSSDLWVARYVKDLGSAVSSRAMAVGLSTADPGVWALY